jgi:hypothetical protein
MKPFKLKGPSRLVPVVVLLAASVVSTVVLGGVLVLFDGVSQDNAIALARAKAAPAASAVVAVEARRSRGG